MTEPVERADPIEVAQAYTEAARWFLSWQSDRLASIEARASALVGLASILAAVVPPVVTASAGDDKWSGTARVLLVVGVVAAAVAVAWSAVGVLRIRNRTSAPNGSAIVTAWKELQADPASYSRISVNSRLAEHLLTAEGDRVDVVTGFTAVVDDRAAQLQRASCVLAGSIAAFTAASLLVTLTG